ncbi:MAG TPA: O-antigen ligase family protein [Candidatus Baltobacteraceae bacterium]|nr:O-antigen ligase family protein [Candidatus Baltobacteraceae bacterium]
MNRLAAAGLVVLFALIPLYGTLAVLDPARPPIPAVVPRPAAAAIGVIAVLALLSVVPGAWRTCRRDLLTLAFLAPGGATILAGLTGFDPVFGIGLGLMVTGVGAAGLVVARALDAAAVRLCLRTFLWSGMLAALAAIAMTVSRHPSALYAYDNGRVVGTFLNPNELAAYTLIALGVALPLAAASRGRDRLAVAAAAVMAITLAATFSRWGIFSAVCGLAIYALLTRARVLLGAAVAVALAGLAINLGPGALHHNPRDTQAREVAWRTGLTTFERFPLLGVGPLAFPRLYDELRPPQAPGRATPVAFDPHSLPLAFAAEGGVVAVVTLTASFWIVLSRVLRAGRDARPVPRALAFGLASALVALLIDGGINTIILFFPLGLQVVPLALAVVRTDAR